MTERREDDRIDLSIIVPIQDEQPSIEELAQRLDEVLIGTGRNYEVILIDDGSSDGSFALMRALAEKNHRFRAIRLARNYGQTAAIACGIRHSRGDVLVTMDGDLQNDPIDIPRLTAELDQGWDVVSGWRRDRKDPFWSRQLPSQIANGLISMATGVKLHDYGCTLKAYRRYAIANASLYGEMHRFMPALAHRDGATVTELAVSHHPRRHGRSKYGILRTAKVLLDLATVTFLDRYLAKPIYVFGGFAIICLSGAGLTLGLLMYHKLAQQISLIQSPLLLLSALLATLGVLSLLMGLLAELTTRTYFESQGRMPYTVRERVNLSD